MIGRAPIAGERGVEHFAQPVNDDRLFDLPKDAAVDLRIVRRRFGRARQGAARHDHELAAERLDGFDLFLVCADDLVDAGIGRGIEMIGADAAADFDARSSLGSVECVADQLLGLAPTEPAAALRRVHRFGDAEAEVPQIVPKCDGLLPVDGGAVPRVDVGERISHHMRRRIGDAIEALRLLLRRKDDRLARGVGFERSLLGRQRDRRHVRLLKS